MVNSEKQYLHNRSLYLDFMSGGGGDFVQMGMCRWIGLLERGLHILGILGKRKYWLVGLKNGTIYKTSNALERFYCMWKVKFSSFCTPNVSLHFFFSGRPIVVKRPHITFVDKQKVTM